MRYLTVFCLLIGVLSCHKKDVFPPVAVDPLQTNGPIERLNSDYTIQIPVTYQGNGAVGFEGLTFNKYRSDGKARLDYAFCSSTFCSEYGQPLSSQPPMSVMLNNVTLNKTVALKQSNQTLGLFYYAEQDKTFGLLYLLKDGQFKESLHFQYDYSLQTEIVGILQTIRPK